MEFEYDTRKSDSNRDKHGITLGQAKGIWAVPHVEIAAKTVDEPRFMVIGKLEGKMYSCICTTRGDLVRLISARRSRQKEEEIYEKAFEIKA